MIKGLNFIERNLDGYIDLDSYLLEKYGSVTIKNNSDIKRDSNIIMITINNDIYYFKPCSNEEIFKEMLADKMLEYLGIEHACYDLACINGEYGVISQKPYSFKSDCSKIPPIVSVFFSLAAFIREICVTSSLKGFIDTYSPLSLYW